VIRQGRGSGCHRCRQRFPRAVTTANLSVPPQRGRRNNVLGAGPLLGVILLPSSGLVSVNGSCKLISRPITRVPLRGQFSPAVDGDQRDGGCVTAVAKNSPGAVMQTFEPPRYTVGAVDLVPQRGAAALFWEHLQQRTADRQDGPRRGQRSGDRCPSGMRCVAMIAGWPGCGS
jgi:hypothetical protein